MPEMLEKRIQNKEMFHFSHSMEAQLGGLTEVGFVITGFYEDRRPEADGNPIRHYMPSFFVVRAQKSDSLEVSAAARKVSLLRCKVLTIFALHLLGCEPQTHCCWR